MANGVDVAEKFLTRKQILERVGVSNVTLLTWIRAKKFPAPRSLSGDQARQCQVRWLESEVNEWMRGRPTREYRGHGHEPQL